MSRNSRKCNWPSVGVCLSALLCTWGVMRAAFEAVRGKFILVTKLWFPNPVLSLSSGLPQIAKCKPGSSRFSAFELLLSVKVGVIQTPFSECVLIVWNVFRLKRLPPSPSNLSSVRWEIYLHKWGGMMRYRPGSGCCGVHSDAQYSAENILFHHLISPIRSWKSRSPVFSPFLSHCCFWCAAFVIDKIMET